MQDLTLINKFRAYINYYESSPEIDSLVEGYLKTATQIVESFLGYPLHRKHHKQTIHLANPTDHIYLNASPICSIEDICVNGFPIDLTTIDISGDKLSTFDGSEPFNGKVDVSFCAGFPFDELPPLIEQTILRIASLLWSEQDGNIGVTSKSFADGSRNFVSYTNYRKYLQEIEAYKGVYF